VTLAGTIPFRNANPDTAQNWPILHFQPNVALYGQNARYAGLTQTLGIQTTCPPEDAQIYGADVGTAIDYSVVQHIGYFRPNTAGTYQFQVPDVRQTVYVWLGDRALAGWKNLNANLIADGRSNAGTNTYLRVVTQRDVGRYIPIRILYANAQDCGEFELNVLGPNNAVLVGRNFNSNDGQFVSCAASTAFPSISFDPILDVGVGLGLGNDNLEIGIGSNLGSLGINASGVNVGDTGNVGQGIGGNLAGLSAALGGGGIGANQNGSLLNLTVGGTGGLGGNPANPGSLLNLTAGGNGVGVGVNGSALGLGGLNLTLPVPLVT
jgi:hypothetical protein